MKHHLWSPGLQSHPGSHFFSLSSGRANRSSTFRLAPKVLLLLVSQFELDVSSSRQNACKCDRQRTSIRSVDDDGAVRRSRRRPPALCGTWNVQSRLRVNLTGIALQINRFQSRKERFWRVGVDVAIPFESYDRSPWDISGCDRQNCCRSLIFMQESHLSRAVSARSSTKSSTWSTWWRALFLVRKICHESPFASLFCLIHRPLRFQER